MKLNTKNIFKSYSLKTSPKPKIKNEHNSKLSSPFIKINKATNNKTNTNSNFKRTLFHNSNKNVNPFSQSSENSQDFKYVKLAKKPRKKSKFKLDSIEKNDLFEDSYNNNMALTNESDNNENNINNKDKKVNSDKDNQKLIQKKQKELSFEQLYDLFKKSSLKSTIIVDNNGNNNLDIEQKKIIEDYFNKKTTKTKKRVNNFTHSIRKISTQINKDNKLLFNRINHYKTSTIDTNDKTNSMNIKSGNHNVKNNLNVKNVKFKNNCIKIKENLMEDNKPLSSKFKKMRSTQINPCLFIFDDNLIIEKEIIKKEENNEKNSIFENDSNISFDSSFLGSSFDEDFYKNFNNIKQ